jgi:ribosomal protein S18 acetylase RimI-like enzyme
MSLTSEIKLGTLAPNELSAASAMAARGMRDNPSSIAIHGDDPDTRVAGLTTMFSMILLNAERPPLVARRHDIIVGLVAASPPDICFFRKTAGRERVLRLGSKRMSVSMPSIPPGMILPMLRLGLGRLGRLSKMGEVGMKNDPKEPHQHVELVVVDAGLQGLGIGRVMMEQVCRDLDKTPVMSHLETDKAENVRFYEHFGFAVVDETDILDAHFWYMQRPAAQSPPAASDAGSNTADDAEQK